ncbi:hypothetical protein QOT17_001346 [Balamuthia mandrillaris]
MLQKMNIPCFCFVLSILLVGTRGSQSCALPPEGEGVCAFPPNYRVREPDACTENYEKPCCARAHRGVNESVGFVCDTRSFACYVAAARLFCSQGCPACTNGDEPLPPCHYLCQAVIEECGFLRRCFAGLPEPMPCAAANEERCSAVDVKPHLVAFDPSKTLRRLEFMEMQARRGQSEYVGDDTFVLTPRNLGHRSSFLFKYPLELKPSWAVGFQVSFEARQLADSPGSQIWTARMWDFTLSQYTFLDFIKPTSEWKRMTFDVPPVGLPFPYVPYSFATGEGWRATEVEFRGKDAAEIEIRKISVEILVDTSY